MALAHGWETARLRETRLRKRARLYGSDDERVYRDATTPSSTFDPCSF